MIVITTNAPIDTSAQFTPREAFAVSSFKATSSLLTPETSLAI